MDGSFVKRKDAHHHDTHREGHREKVVNGAPLRYTFGNRAVFATSGTTSSTFHLVVRNRLCHKYVRLIVLRAHGNNQYTVNVMKMRTNARAATKVSITVRRQRVVRHRILNVTRYNRMPLAMNLVGRVHIPGPGAVTLNRWVRAMIFAIMPRHLTVIFPITFTRGNNNQDHLGNKARVLATLLRNLRFGFPFLDRFFGRERLVLRAGLRDQPTGTIFLSNLNVNRNRTIITRVFLRMPVRPK